MDWEKVRIRELEEERQELLSEVEDWKSRELKPSFGSSERVKLKLMEDRLARTNRELERLGVEPPEPEELGVESGKA